MTETLLIDFGFEKNGCYYLYIKDHDIRIYENDINKFKNTLEFIEWFYKRVKNLYYERGQDNIRYGIRNILDIDDDLDKIKNNIESLENHCYY